MNLIPLYRRVSLAMILLFWPCSPASGGLYQCVTETEGTIYTDTPSQLESCAPIPASGAVTSLATSSGHPATGSVPDSSSMTPIPTHPTAELPPPGVTPSTLDPVPLSTTAPLPCPVGINPLNPFTNSPCPGADLPMPAGPPVSADSTAQPAPR